MVIIINSYFNKNYISILKNEELKLEVSIIIVNYNCFDLLEKCLETLQEHTKIEHEVIVVDNGSTSGDIEPLLTKYPKVKLIKLTSNLGFAAANNLGISEATGDYLFLINNDVIFTEDVISSTVAYSKTINDEAIIGCKLFNEDGSHQISIVDFDSISNLFGENFFIYKLFSKSRTFNKYHRNYKLTGRPEEVDVIKGAFFAIPKKIYELVGKLDERFFFYYEETEFCLRYKKLGGKIIYFPLASIIHIGGSSSESNHWFKYYNQHVAKIKYFQKHFSGFKFFIACLLHYTGLLMRVPIYVLTALLKMNPNTLKKAGLYLRSFFIYPKNIFKVSH